MSGITRPEDVTRLKEEVAELRPSSTARERRRTALRRAALSFLLVLGCRLVAMSLIAAFVRAT